MVTGRPQSDPDPEAKPEVAGQPSRARDYAKEMDRAPRERSRLAARQEGQRVRARGTNRKGRDTPMTDSSSAPQPLAPPTATEPPLTLTAPTPSTAVATTAAGAIAPAVDPAALPGLDAKVEDYLGSLLTVAPQVPRVRGQGQRRPLDGRPRHPAGGREQQPAARAPRSGR